MKSPIFCATGVTIHSWQSSRLAVGPVSSTVNPYADACQLRAYGTARNRADKGPAHNGLHGQKEGANDAASRG
jgi:hypothetical protein